MKIKCFVLFYIVFCDTFGSLYAYLYTKWQFCAHTVGVGHIIFRRKIDIASQDQTLLCPNQKDSLGVCVCVFFFVCVWFCFVFLFFVF